MEKPPLKAVNTVSKAISFPKDFHSIWSLLEKSQYAAPKTKKHNWLSNCKKQLAFKKSLSGSF